MRIKKIKAKSVKRCTVCGKKFDMWDVQESFRFHHRVGYGSKYDGRDLNLNMCCACFDGLMDELVPRCKTNLFQILMRNWQRHIRKICRI